ncbi:iron-sulfur cluster assembly 1 homolog, mitochondrial-like isoform X2 [Cetorhinus maximus]
MSGSILRASIRAVSAKRRLVPTRAALTLTPLAVNKIKQLLQEKPEYIGLKIGVRTRGCNGLSYTLEYTKEKRESDEEVIQDVLHLISSKLPTGVDLQNRWESVQSMQPLIQNKPLQSQS